MKFFSVVALLIGFSFFCRTHTSEQYSVRNVERFFNAVEEGSIPVIKKMLKNKAVPLNVKNKQGQAALHITSCNADKKTFEYLISRGALLESIDDKGLTVIHYAVISQNSAWVEYVSQKYSVYKDISDANGVTPLMLAAYCGYEEICKKLIVLGARVDLCDLYNSSVCMCAVHGGILCKVPELCKQAELEKQLKNKEGLSSLPMAEIFEHYDDADFLLASGYTRSLTSEVKHCIMNKMGALCYKKLLLRSAEYYHPDLFECAYAECGNAEEVGALKQIYNLTLQECSQEFCDQVVDKIAQAILDGDEEKVMKFLVADRVSAWNFNNFSQLKTNDIHAMRDKKKSFTKILAWLAYAGNKRMRYKQFFLHDVIVSWDDEDSMVFFLWKTAHGLYLRDHEMQALLKNSQSDLIFKKLFGVMLSYGNPVYKQLCYYYRYVRDKNEFLHALFAQEYALWKTPSLYRRFFLQKLALAKIQVMDIKKMFYWSDVVVHTCDK